MQILIGLGPTQRTHTQHIVRPRLVERVHAVAILRVTACVDWQDMLLVAKKGLVCNVAVLTILRIA